LREVVADEAIDAEDEDFFHELETRGIGFWPRRAGRAAGAMASPSTSSDRILSTPPSPQRAKTGERRRHTARADRLGRSAAGQGRLRVMTMRCAVKSKKAPG
jgi:hypothetical protein